MDLKEINKRYSELSESDCCLSCGNALNFGEPKPGEVCIDLGSGRGTDVIRMAEAVGNEGFVYGIDVSDGMIDKAILNAQKFQVSNVRFINSPLEKIDLPDNSANLIISNCTINHSDNKISVWSEIYRLLKPNGRFVVSDIYSIEQVPDDFRNDPVAVAECWAGAVTKEEYFKHLAIAGFSFVDIIEESKPYKKGKIEVVSFTIAGVKEPKKSCCCCG